MMQNTTKNILTDNIRNMHIDLLNKLLEKNILRINAEITAQYRTYDISKTNTFMATGTFNIDKIVQKNNKWMFMTHEIYTGKNQLIEGENIIAIDGMDLDRYAACYSMTETGDKLSMPTKRGRKTNIERAARLAEMNHGEEFFGDENDDDEDCEYDDFDAVWN